jgi:hypothetical protein
MAAAPSWPYPYTNMRCERLQRQALLYQSSSLVSREEALDDVDGGSGQVGGEVRVLGSFGNECHCGLGRPFVEWSFAAQELVSAMTSRDKTHSMGGQWGEKQTRTYRRIPMDHQSEAAPWPLLRMISGAM